MVTIPFQTTEYKKISFSYDIPENQASEMLNVVYAFFKSLDVVDLEGMLEGMEGCLKRLEHDWVIPRDDLRAVMPFDQVPQSRITFPNGRPCTRRFITNHPPKLVSKVPMTKSSGDSTRSAISTTSNNCTSLANNRRRRRESEESLCGNLLKNSTI